MPRRAALVLALIACAAPARLRAQAAPPAVVRVRVTDSDGAPLGGVSLVVIRANEQGSLVGTSDDMGRHTFVFVPDSGSYRIMARRVGYVQTTRLLPVRVGDTLSVALALARIPPQLDTVHVDARARSDDYLITAKMIANVQHHYVKDAYDALRDINPNMLGDGARDCRPTRNIWVNGSHVGFSPSPAYDLPISQSKNAPVGPTDAWTAQPGVFAVGRGRAVSVPPSGSPPAHAKLGDLLSLVKPEHIATITYRNCWDNSLPGWGGRNAIFITLRDGYTFDSKLGSYPVDSVPHSH